jgi:hypothetical protein
LKGEPMDPNANFAERIAMIRAAGSYELLSDADMVAFMELTDAYADWRSMGGFPADREIRTELLTLCGTIHN